ncbi:UPF0587 protein v1g245604-like [Pollicipes pollicipes]|uniref:UPF0587 protein v1g245604-like n=1 Tax=Pollicipes pollicipes TaxID=41117 RepID=UPI0018850031|nr:UPF0587 protein v1g245604-like [Pollicipes pollicipes]
MVKIGLQLKATLENVASVQPDEDDFRWYLKLRCANCGDEPDHFQYACGLDTTPVRGGRGHANLVVKCKLCGRENTLDIVENSGRPLTESDIFQTVVAFDCRGLEPTDFSPRIGWACRGTDSDTPFANVDLSEKEWVEYDEKANQSVSPSPPRALFEEAEKGPKALSGPKIKGPIGRLKVCQLLQNT